MTTTSSDSAATRGQRATGTIAVQADRVSVSYGSRVALSDLDFATPAGASLALIGPNGSGKSTLLKAVVGLLPVRRGRLTVLGASPTRARPRIGYMPQSDELDPEFPVTVRQVVAMGLLRPFRWSDASAASDATGAGGLRLWPSRAERRSVDRAIERVGATALAKRRFGALSGGQRQRVLLARALVSSPRLLLLDEPFNGLDATSRRVLVDVMRSLTTQGVTMMVSTHDLSLARDACDTVLLLAGHQVAYGPIASTLVLDNLERAYGDVQVELDEHTVVVPPHDGDRPTSAGRGA